MHPQYRIPRKRIGIKPVMCLMDSPFHALHSLHEGLAMRGLVLSVSGARNGLRYAAPEGLWYQGSHEVPAVSL